MDALSMDEKSFVEFIVLGMPPQPANYEKIIAADLGRKSPNDEEAFVLELGALLPCNVIVYETDDGDIIVSAVDPKQLIDITDNPALDSISEDVSGRFERVLNTL